MWEEVKISALIGSWKKWIPALMEDLGGGGQDVREKLTADVETA